MQFGAPGFLELLILGVICLFVFVLPLAILGVLLFKLWKPSPETESAERVPCPYCAELIMPRAVRCRFCGTRLDGSPE